MQQTICPNILNLHCQTSTHTFLKPPSPSGTLGQRLHQRKKSTMRRLSGSRGTLSGGVPADLAAARWKRAGEPRAAESRERQDPVDQWTEG